MNSLHRSLTYLYSYLASLISYCHCVLLIRPKTSAYLLSVSYYILNSDLLSTTYQILTDCDCLLLRSSHLVTGPENHHGASHGAVGMRPQAFRFFYIYAALMGKLTGTLRDLPGHGRPILSSGPQNVSGSTIAILQRRGVV